MRVLLVSNTNKERAAGALADAASWLSARGISYDEISSERLVISDPYLAERAAVVGQYDLVVCLGGDGTILRVSRMIGDTGVPLLALNFGGMGFLASAQADDLLPALASAVEGRATIDPRSMANVDVTYDDGSTERHTALNEVVISRGNFGRIVCLDLFINDSFIEHTRGDGVLVSTTTGSTAYALSAGGPLVSTFHNGLVVVPISPHTLKAWSIVTGTEDVVVLKPSAENEQRIVLFVDGEVLWSTEAASQLDTVGGGGSGSASLADPEVVAVAVQASQTYIKLLRPFPYDYYGHIASAFFGNAQ